MAIKQFQTEVTYEQYCLALASMEGQQVAFSFVGPLQKWMATAKETLEQIATTAGIAFKELLVLFKNRDMFALLKGVGFNLKKLLIALAKVTTLIPLGLLNVMEEVAKSELLQKIKVGAAKVDDLLNKHPLLKRLAGIALAGLLFYMWLNMSFIGDFSFDMDLGMVIDAFRGKFTIEDLFLTPGGLTMLTLFSIGAFTGLSFPWVGSSVVNLLIALCFTTARRLNKTALAQKLKPLLELKRYS
jgi:hypothetical protein